jgi:hypothetical protein
VSGAGFAQHRERAAYVHAPLGEREAALLARFGDARKQMQVERKAESAADVPRDVVRLIEAALAQATDVQRHRHQGSRPGSRLAGDCRREELAEEPSMDPLAPELEAADEVAHGVVVEVRREGRVGARESATPRLWVVWQHFGADRA